MTYCLGLLLPDGLVMASDSRSNAGVDQITKVRKLAVFEKSGERGVCILSAGNLATTQSVVTELRHGFGKGNPVSDLELAPSMFDVARMVGDKLRYILARDAEYVSGFGDPNASFLVGGEIAGDRHRLFQVYSAGNVIECTARSGFLQIGETKYGKPILDRALALQLSMREAAKLALLSFDATIRSNLSVAPPIDMVCYTGGALQFDKRLKFSHDSAYWNDLRKTYSESLLATVLALPDVEI